MLEYGSIAEMQNRIIEYRNILALSESAVMLCVIP